MAATGHRVVAAPYHRLDKGILASEVILSGAAREALSRMRALGVDYLVLCAVPGQVAAPGSMRTALLAGRQMPMLTEVSLAAGGPIRAWRLEKVR